MKLSTGFPVPSPLLVSRLAFTTPKSEDLSYQVPPSKSAVRDRCTDWTSAVFKNSPDLSTTEPRPDYADAETPDGDSNRGKESEKITKKRG